MIEEKEEEYWEIGEGRGLEGGKKMIGKGEEQGRTKEEKKRRGRGRGDREGKREEKRREEEWKRRGRKEDGKGIEGRV